MNKKEYSIASRHVLSFLLLIALPVLVVVFLTGYFFRQEIIRTARAQREAALIQNAGAIDAELQRISLTASSLIHSRSLMNGTLEYIQSESAEQRYVLSFAFEDIFNTYFRLSRQLGSFCIFFSDGSAPFISRNYSGINYSPEDLAVYASLAETNPHSVAFYDSLYSGPERTDELPVVSLVVSPPERTNYATGIKTLLVSYIVNELVNFTGGRTGGGGVSPEYVSHAFLIGREGAVLSSSDASSVGQDFSALFRNLEKDNIIMTAPIDASGWTVAEAINIQSLIRPVDRMMNGIYAAMAIIVILFIGYNSLFFGDIVRPLNSVIAKMEAVATGDFSVRAELSSYAELNRVSNSFNFMVGEINALTEAIKNEQHERLKSEIEVLRYQLNPHFLCNTLNSIRMMAVITKNDAIQKMTAALMTITEDTIGRDDTVYSLEHEIRNLDSYVYIMKVRYGDTFDFIKDIDSSLLKLGVPAMILQPLVENAILHGLNGLARSGTIVVSASCPEDSLILEVRDDGFGMDEAVRENIFEAGTPVRKGFSRIGLSGVRRRIMLAYGGAYGVEVSSFPGEGTAVTLTLPLLEAAEYGSRFDKEPGGGNNADD